MGERNLFDELFNNDCVDSEIPGPSSMNNDVTLDDSDGDSNSESELNWKIPAGIPDSFSDFDSDDENVLAVSQIMGAATKPSKNPGKDFRLKLKRKLISVEPNESNATLSAIRKRAENDSIDFVTETTAEAAASSDEEVPVPTEEESETETGDDDESTSSKKGKKKKSKKKTSRAVWTTDEPAKTLKKRHPKDICTERPGPTGFARRVRTELASFLLFMTMAMMQLILERTNEVIALHTPESDRYNERYKPMDIDELMALIGLLLYRGLHRDTKNPTQELWSHPDAQRPMYKALFDRTRFHFLLRCLSFHDPRRLRIDYTNDLFVKMRELLTLFENNLRQNYRHTELVCLDETLRNHFSQTNCDFLIFMPDKPGQMGLFFYTLADSVDRYMSRIIPKVKTPISEEEKKVHTHELVMEITSDIVKTGRNLTADRGFTAIETVEELLKKNTTYVGTIMKNRRGLPMAAKESKQRPVHSTSFFWKIGNPSLMCMSYIPKRSKNVLVVTTATNEPVVDGGTKSKPEAILFYNEQRCGVDIFNKMVRELSSQSKTDDWRISTFTFLLDVACINAQTILKYNMPGKHDNRRYFLTRLIHQLVAPWLKKRFQRPELATETKDAIKVVLKQADPSYDTDAKPNPAKLGVPAKCFICFDEATKIDDPKERRKKKKNLNIVKKWFCPKCNAAICPKHRINLPGSLERVCAKCV